MELSKVRVYEKRKELLRILHDPDPGHAKKCYIVGFLYYIGYNYLEICKIIKDNNKWLEYNEDITNDAVLSVIKSARKQREQERKEGKTPTTPNIHAKTSGAKSLHREYNIDDLISYFKENTTPIKPFYVPGVVKYAAATYLMAGFSVIPKADKPATTGCTNKKCIEAGFCKHQPLSMNWKQYAYRFPSWDELEGWDWSYGVCLIPHENIAILDLDVPGYEKYFEGYHKEKSRSRGLHVFANGSPKDQMQIKGIGQIKKFGGLVIVAPTPGYKVIK